MYVYYQKTVTSLNIVTVIYGKIVLLYIIEFFFY